MKTLDLRGALIDIELPRASRSMLEVTMLHRPDPNWKFTDKQGHTHKWIDLGGSFQLPTLREVTDVPAVMGADEDGEFEEIPAITHLECLVCGERIEPGYRADETAQYVEGLLEPPDIRITTKEEKLGEILKAFESNECHEIIFFEETKPIIGRVIEVNVGANIRATIRRK